MLPDWVLLGGGLILLPFYALYEFRRFDTSDKHRHWLRLPAYAAVLLWMGLLVSLLASRAGTVLLIAAFALVVVAFLVRRWAFATGTFRG